MKRPTQKYLAKLCDLLYSTHYLPIACFSGSDMSHLACSYQGLGKIFEEVAGRIDTGIMDTEAGLFGVVGIGKGTSRLITGPFLNKKPDADMASALMHAYSLDASELAPMKQFLLSLPRYSLNRFLNFLGLLSFLFNDEEPDISGYFRHFAPMVQKNVAEKRADELWAENDFSHGTYYLERQMLSLVSAGDVHGLNKLFESIAKATPVAEGKLADDTLRQSKNIFIGLICMVGKVGAIRGNLDIEETYQLIDLYTQECERCLSVDQVNRLRYSAIIDFTRRVAEHSHPDVYSDEVERVLQFIRNNANRPIGVPDVIGYAHKSRSAFMKQFKDETGETIGRYIVKSKLQEAKQLLAYSDRSLAEISSFLYFSSQSYFQNLFKKQYGMTPLEYRRTHRKQGGSIATGSS